MPKQEACPKVIPTIHEPSLSNRDILEKIAIMGGNRALASIGQACGEEEEYQEKLDFLIRIALKRMQ